jgi:hypothetical protein
MKTRNDGTNAINTLSLTLVKRDSALHQCGTYLFFLFYRRITVFQGRVKTFSTPAYVWNDIDHAQYLYCDSDTWCCACALENNISRNEIVVETVKDSRWRDEAQ